MVAKVTFSSLIQLQTLLSDPPIYLQLQRICVRDPVDFQSSLKGRRTFALGLPKQSQAAAEPGTGLARVRLAEQRCLQRAGTVSGPQTP